jgi:hypothetical protein
VFQSQAECVHRTLLYDVVTKVQQLLCRIRYLWIDARWIIHDDINDWIQEGTRMADIYRTTWSDLQQQQLKTPWKGSIHPKTSQSLFPCSICETENSTSRVINPVDRAGLGTTLLDLDLAQLPLQVRITMRCQERVLAPRSIHFTKDHSSLFVSGLLI